MEAMKGGERARRVRAGDWWGKEATRRRRREDVSGSKVKKCWVKVIETYNGVGRAGSGGHFPGLSIIRLWYQAVCLVL